MPLNTSGADAMIRILAEDAASAKIKAIEYELKQLERNVDATSRANEKMRSTNAGNELSLVAVGKAIAVVTAAVVTLKKAWDFAEEGAQLQRLRSSADDLAAHYGANMDSMLESLRQYSMGTISNTDLILSADKAMMLGVSANADQLGQVLQIAALRGRAMGVDTTKAFNDIVTGIGRMSPRILDNLGIVIDADTAYASYAQSIGKTASELTDLEKRQALLSAVLQDGNAMLADAGGLADDNAASYERLRAAFTNYTDEAKIEAASFFGAINNYLTDALNKTTLLIEQQRRYKEMMSGAQPATPFLQGPANTTFPTTAPVAQTAPGTQPVAGLASPSFITQNDIKMIDAWSQRMTGLGALYKTTAVAIAETSTAQDTLNIHTQEWIGMNLADKMAMVDASVQSLTYSTQDYFGLVMDLQGVENEYVSTMEDLATKRTEINDNQKMSDEDRLAALKKIDEAERQAAATALEASEKIVFAILSQKLAADGNYDAIIRLGEAWGMIDPNVAKAGEAILNVLNDGTMSAQEQRVEIDKITASMLKLPDSAKKADEGTAAPIDAMNERFHESESTTQDVLENIYQLGALQGTYTYTLNIVVNGSIPDLPTGGMYASGRCFIAGTQVELANGHLRNIEDVRVGDVVLSMEPATGWLLPARVTDVIRHEASEMQGGYLLLNENLGVTPEHLVYVNGTWQAAGIIKVGDQLLSKTGKMVAVTHIRFVQACEPVYNIHTDQDVHNYFANGVLVHNAKTGSDAGLAYAQGGQMDMGEGWKAVGEAGLELVSPSGYVFDHSKSLELMRAGIAPDSFYRVGGDMSADEAAYYRKNPRGTERGPRRPRAGNPRGRRPNAGTDEAGGDPTAEAVATIAAVTNATVNLAGAVVTTGQQQTQTTQTQTATLSAQNDEVIASLNNIERLLTRLPTAADQIALARAGAAMSV